MHSTVSIDVQEQVGILTINNPPINAGSLEVRAGLLQAIKEIANDDCVLAAVIIGAGSTFIAGSDLREFGQPLVDPQLPEVIAAIENLPKPVVAALHGAALGGGLELALGCDGRVASNGTVLGLPEVTLGIIPGAGGTQRLPRLIGIPDAIRMICSGERVPAGRAISLGIIDRVSEGDLRSDAIAFAQALSGQKRLLRQLPVPMATEQEISDASSAALRAGRNRPAVIAAIEAVKSAATVPVKEALANERAVFQTLRISDEAKALRYQFFAERESGKRLALKGESALTINKVGVIGAGTMGAGIAIAALEGNYEVILLDREESSLKRGLAQINEHYSTRVKVGKVSREQADRKLSCLRSGIDWTLIADADLVIEAVFEDIEIKKEVFKRLDALAKPGAVLASNTSYLDLDELALTTSRPQDVVGLHFFSPANVMRLVEVVKGKQTSPQVLATGLSVARNLKKLPVITGNAFGFIGNRIYAAYRRQCEMMLEEGAYPQDIDAALEEFGFSMGPFAVADMSGLDIAWRMRLSQAATRNPSHRYVQIPDKLCEAGRFGRKTGQGYYRYESGAKGRHVDPVVTQLIEEQRRQKSIVARNLSSTEICNRVLLTMANEAAAVLNEGIAIRASDIDVVLVNGYGFPRWEGGPVFWARMRGKNWLDREIHGLAEISGQGFIRSDTSVLYEEGS